MFKRPRKDREGDTDALLREGMRALFVPEASSDFDARVHRALAADEADWTYRWNRIRPVVASAILSMAASIILLAATQAPPSSHLRFPRRSAASYAKGAEPLPYGIAGMANRDASEQDSLR